jgi:hypothetical protein
LLRVAGSLSTAELQRIAGLPSVAGQAMSWSLTIFRLQTTLLSLAYSEGVALIGLGGVNIDRLRAFSKFNPNFLVLPNPIYYLLLELLLSLRHFLDLWEAFLRVFSNLSNFLLGQTTALFDWVSYLPSWWHRNWPSPSRLPCTCGNLW